MLANLSIRDVVLIDALDLGFDEGLSVLTGETGAGKSILLDSLGLALGGRSDAGLIRTGADKATVTAAFDVAADHPARELLHEQGLDAEGPIVLRRVLGRDGRTRAYVNDQPASIALMRRVGDLLVEIQGQFEQRGLLDPATHRAALDAYGNLTGQAASVRDAHRAWQDAMTALDDHVAAVREAAADEDYLRHALDELDRLAPRPGEDAALQEQRLLLMNREKLVDALNAALAEIGGARPVEDVLRAAQREIERVVDKAGGTLDTILATLDRAAIEVSEAAAQLEAAGATIDADTDRLQEVDDRLFALRDVARKHRVTVDDLPTLQATIRERLTGLEDQSERTARLRKAVEETRTAYRNAAQELSEARSRAARELDAAVSTELPPLRLDRARFVTAVEQRPEAEWGAAGMDRIGFLVATNPGTEPGPIGRIASGGELARFMLALRVVLSRGSAIPTLVFDEVDSGIGGATAHAVGERLSRLGSEIQVLVVTHSPQVAARGDAHWRVEKVAGMPDDPALTRVARLADGERREEVARMLSGEMITDEARAAADALIRGERP